MVRAVFVFEGNDLSVHPSLERAAGSVEAIDVDNAAFDFFTEDGTVLRGTTNDQDVTLHETDESRPDELRERLRRYLSHPRVDLDPGLADDPLAAAQTILDREWERRPFKWFRWLDRRANGPSAPVV